MAAAGALLLSCGGSSSTTNPPSGLKFRAFVSQNISATTASPGLIIINAQLDRVGAASTISAGPSPGILAEPTNHQLTLVANTSDSEVDVVNNAKEASNGKVTLPGVTQSLAVTSDATLGFAAVPTAPVPGLTPGEVEIINLASTTLEAPVPNCPPPPPPAGDANCLSGARYLVLSPDNTHLLIFGDNTQAFAVADLTNVGTGSAPSWTVTGTNQVTGSSAQLDHPVWATFSPDGGTAYILSCGGECGGSTASVTPMTFAPTGSQCLKNCLGATTPLAGGATYSVASGNAVYVVGSEQCKTSGANPTSCGKLTVLNTSGSTVQVIKTATITDGYHSRMVITSDNQVFVGAQGCTQVLTNAQQRGCLSIYSANNGNVVIGKDLGDVTGMAAVSGRPQVYVVEGGELRNWTTTTDTLAPALQQIDIVGQAIDIILAD